MSDWISVEDRLPYPAMMVLVAWTDNLTNQFVLMAEYSNGKSLPVMDECLVEGYGNYDEETDELWCPIGWFESNQSDEILWEVSGDVTHWMPLPNPPEVNDD